MKNKWKINENKKMIEKQNEKKMKLQMKTQMKNKWKKIILNISNLWLDANHIIYRHIISYHDTSIIPAPSNGKSNFLLIVRPCGQPHDVVFNGNYSREMCIRQSANTTDVSKT